MKRILNESDKRLLEKYNKELVDARDQEKKNTTRMPRLEGYIEALNFCISHIKFTKDKGNVQK